MLYFFFFNFNLSFTNLLILFIFDHNKHQKNNYPIEMELFCACVYIYCRETYICRHPVCSKCIFNLLANKHTHMWAQTYANTSFPVKMWSEYCFDRWISHRYIHVVSFHSKLRKPPKGWQVQCLIDSFSLEFPLTLRNFGKPRPQWFALQMSCQNAIISLQLFRHN